MKTKLMTMILAAGAAFGAWAANVRVYVNISPDAGWGSQRYFYSWSNVDMHLSGSDPYAWPGVEATNTVTVAGATWHYIDLDVLDLSSGFPLIINDNAGRQTVIMDLDPSGLGEREAFFVENGSVSGMNEFSGNTTYEANVRIGDKVHDKVQLWEGGPYWATTNVGAEKPEDYGYYFWWGDTIGYKWENNAWVASDGSSSDFPSESGNMPTYSKDVATLQSEGWVVSENGTYVLAPEHDAAQVQWGGGWRMPTYQELYDLCYNKCDWTWTTQNGVNGYVVRGRGDYASNSIFLPCAGYGRGTSLFNSGFYGHYLSSVPYSDSYRVYVLAFGSVDHSACDLNRYLGRSVRPVQDAPTTTSGDATVTPDVSITAGEYFKATLAELGYDVPTDGQTAYSVKAYGLPAGLKLVGNKAVTKKDKKGKKVVVTPANVEWWIEGVPTAALDYATNPPYLVITVDGVAQTLPLSLGVEAQEVMELDDLAFGDQLNEQFYLPGVTNGWTVSGLPTGLKYTAKLVTTTKKKGKKIVSVTTNALPYSVYGKPTKAGLFTITAKKKTGGFNETMKYRVLVRPAPVDTAIFGDSLTNITTMAYVPLNWNLESGEAVPSVLPVPFVPSAVGGKVAKVAGLPTGLAFAAKDTYAYTNAKKKTGKYLKQAAQTIVGTPTKPGTYVVTFTKNVTTGTGKNKKTVAKTAQILWTVVANDAELELAFNIAGGVIEGGSVGLKYGDLMAFTTTDGAAVTASGLPKGITLANLGDGQYAFKGFTAKAGTYLVTVTATLNGKTVTQRLALKVDGLPDWAKGTYNGVVYATGETPVVPGNAQAARSTNGLATVTVSSAGKISGKFQEFGTNWTFSASSYTGAVPGTRDACPYQEFTCSNVVAKYAYKVTKTVKGKKQTVTKYLTREFTLDVSETEGMDPARGMVCMEEIPPEGAAGTAIEAYQNLWGQSGYTALGKKLFYTSKKVPCKTWTSVEADGLGEYDTLSMKVTPAGVATATYKFFKGTFDKKGKPQYATYACTTVLHPETSAEAGPDGFGAMIYLYFPSVASAGFKKYAEIVRYPFTDRKANVPDKAAIDAAKWCAGEYLGYGYAEFPGEDWLYGIFRVSVGADLAFTGTFEAIDGGVADFSGKLVKNVADGVAITVNGTPMSMGVKAMAKPYGKSKYGEIFAWSEAEEGQPNIHIDRAWQNIWTSVGMAAARPKIAPDTTKTVDLAGAEIYRYPMGDYVDGDSLTYTFAEDGTVSVTGQVFGVPVDTTAAIAVETESGGTCDCILTFMINGRVFQQNFTMPSSGTVTSESISLDVSSSNFGIING